MVEKSTLYNRLQPGTSLFSIDLGSQITKFLLVKHNQEGGVDLSYELLEENLYRAKKGINKKSLFTKTEKILKKLKISKNTSSTLIISQGLGFEKISGDTHQAIKNFKKENYVYTIHSSDTDNQAQKEISVVLINKKEILRFLSQFERIGIKISKVIPSPVALIHSAQCSLNLDEKSNLNALLDIGANTTSCFLIKDNTPITSEIFPHGGELLTQLLSKKLHVTPQDAEHIKKAEYERTLNIMNEVIQDFVKDLKKYFKDLRELHNFHPTKIFLSGGTANLPGIIFYLEEALNVPVQIWGMRGKVSLGASVPTTRKFLTQEPLLASAVGASLHPTEKKEIKKVSSPNTFFFKATSTLRKWGIFIIIFLSVYCLGIYVEKLQVLKDFIAGQKARKVIQLAKDENRLLNIQGIHISQEAATALINGAFFQVGDSIRGKVILKEVNQDYIVLFDGYDNIIRQPSEFYIIKKEDKDN